MAIRRLRYSPGLETYCAEIENDRMTLSAILKSPHSIEFRLQLDDWIHSLRELGKSETTDLLKSEVFH